MGGQQLVTVLRKYHIADLRARANRVNEFKLLSIPQFDGFVGSASTANQQAMLVWRPSKALDCSHMLIEPDNLFGHLG